MKSIKNTFIIFSVLPLFLFIIIFSACKNTEYYIFDSIEYFNTRTYIALEKNGNEEEFLTFSKTLLSSLDNEFSLNKNNSLVSLFNSSEKDIKLPLSENAKEIFLLSETYHSLFPDFDPSVYPLLNLWKLSSSTYPYENFDKSFIEQTLNNVPNILPLCDFNKIQIDENNYTVSKSEDGVSVDFGGVVKGYATEKLYKKALALGYKKGYISLGGSSMYILSSDDPLYVIHPRNNGYILSVNKDFVSDKSISTSGDYNRYYTVDGKRYSHIIDVKTGRPIDNGIVAATVIGKDAAFGDALSTALCCSDYYPNDKEKSPLFSLIEKAVKNSECVVFVTFINGNEKQVITNAKNTDYNLLDSSFSIVNI